MYVTSSCLSLLLMGSFFLGTEAGECLEKFSKYNPDHTACSDPSEYAEIGARPMTEEQKKGIVDAHNNYRAAVDPPATNMGKMEWDDELAMIAQRFSDQCVIGHDKGEQRYIPGRGSLGQNMGSSWSGPFSQAVDQWHSEVKDFNYGGASTGVTGHYTQVVWANSAKVGCGATKCNNPGQYKGLTIIICNYFPLGNWNLNRGALPYVKGTKCSGCKNCVDGGLCDCGGLVCRNGGTIDYSTCTCDCQGMGNTLAQPDCKTNCTAPNTDKSWCGRDSFVKEKCHKGYVANICPFMCEICPLDEGNNNNGGNNGGGAEATTPEPTTPEPTTPEPTTAEPTTPVPETTPDAAVCIDQHGSCSYWASRGECDKNPGWMHPNCENSCDTCDESLCVDREKDCATLTAGNGCSSAHVTLNCRKTCDACDDCSDKNKYCRGWAKRGECEKNPRYMKWNCKKSCKQC